MWRGSMEQVVTRMNELGDSMARAMFLAKKYAQELGEPLDLFTNGDAIMIRAQGDTPDPADYEMWEAAWEFVGEVE